ncbi:transporter substrate-binding domain-containing protein [soil metagenome]
MGLCRLLLHRMGFSHRASPCLAVILAIMAGAAGSGGAQAEESRLDAILKRDKLVVAVSNSTMPTGFIDENGTHTGFEIEFARLLAKSILGSPDKIEFVVVNAAGRFPAVLSGRVDFGIASATIYPDRAVRLAFTRPYMDSTTFVVVPKDSAIKKIADLDSADVTFGASNTAAMIDRAKRYAPKAKAQYFDTDSAAFQALKSRRVSAVQADSAAAEFQFANSKGAWVKLPGQLGSLNGNALFMKPGDFQLWLCLDTIVGEYIHGSRYDEYEALYRKWFGADPPPARFYSAK